MPKVDSEVLCIFTEDGEGICLNGYYHPGNLPADSDKYSYIKKLSDKVIVGIDKATGELLIIAEKMKVIGDIAIEGNLKGDIHIDGNLIGNISVTGNLSVSGSISTGGRTL